MSDRNAVASPRPKWNPASVVKRWVRIQGEKKERKQSHLRHGNHDHGNLAFTGMMTAAASRRPNPFTGGDA